MKAFYLPLLFLTFFLLSCGSSKTDELPAGVIDTKQMVQIMADLHMLESATQTRNLWVSDSSASQVYSYYRHLFDKHQLQDSTFLVSFDYYLKHPDAMKNIYTEVITELSKRQAAVSSQAPNGR